MFNIAINLAPEVVLVLVLVLGFGDDGRWGDEGEEEEGG